MSISCGPFSELLINQSIDCHIGLEQIQLNTNVSYIEKRPDQIPETTDYPHRVCCFLFLVLIFSMVS
jgi:hypothetical protein